MSRNSIAPLTRYGPFGVASIVTWAMSYILSCRQAKPCVHDWVNLTPPSRKTLLLCIDHLARHTAIDHEFRAGDKGAFRADQIRHQRGDVLDSADPACRMLRVILRAQLLPAHVNPARAYAIH